MSIRSISPVIHGLAAVISFAIASIETPLMPLRAAELTRSLQAFDGTEFLRTQDVTVLRDRPISAASIPGVGQSAISSRKDVGPGCEGCMSQNVHSAHLASRGA